MKLIIFGLGNFGASLAMKMVKNGHEVIAVDKNYNRVKLLKDHVNHAVSLDSTDRHAVNTLPIADADVVVVGIGEDEGASLMTSALMKELKVAKIISRAISPLHQTVLEAMGIEEIIHPEEDSAERLAQKLCGKGVLDSFDLSGHFKIVETKVPKRFIGKKVIEVKFREEYKINIVTILKRETRTNLLGIKSIKERVVGIISPDTILYRNDILVIFGSNEDINTFTNTDN